MRLVLVALSVLLVVPACRSDGGGTPVSFTAKDGVRLAGEEFGTGAKGVVLAHGPDTDRRSWRGYARVLAGGGLHVGIFDFRGYGAPQGGGRPRPSRREV